MDKWMDRLKLVALYLKAIAIVSVVIEAMLLTNGGQVLLP